MNDLTTDAAVIAYEPRVSGLDQASARDPKRLGVSERMVRWMGRRYVSPIEVGVQQVEFATGGGMGDGFLLDDWPAANLAITHNGTALDAASFRVEGDRLVRYIGGGIALPWPRGEYLLQYDAGAAVAGVPSDLQDAATWQTAFELLRLEQKNLGVEQREPQTGATETLTSDGWLQSVRDVMLSHRSLT